MGVLEAFGPTYSLTTKSPPSVSELSNLVEHVLERLDVVQSLRDEDRAVAARGSSSIVFRSLAP